MVDEDEDDEDVKASPEDILSMLNSLTSNMDNQRHRVRYGFF